MSIAPNRFSQDQATLADKPAGPQATHVERKAGNPAVENARSPQAEKRLPDAFGKNGRPASGDEGAVPPDSSLQIDLELISWKTVTDITRDKKVVKKTLKEGEKYERPNDGSVVQGKVFALTNVSVKYLQSN